MIQSDALLNWYPWWFNEASNQIMWLHFSFTLTGAVVQCCIPRKIKIWPKFTLYFPTNYMFYSLRLKQRTLPRFISVLFTFTGTLLKNDPKFKSSLRRKPEANSIKRVKWIMKLKMLNWAKVIKRRQNTKQS